jgi:drug/metabolite transporter (DMT)-like permease
MHTAAPRYVAWTCIACVALLAIAGEVMIAAAMRQVGDLDIIRAKSGLPGAIRTVLSNPTFLIGALCMALNFFAMLFTLSLVDLSLAAPGIFLREKVDRRRWLATTFVCAGVYLLAR